VTHEAHVRDDEAAAIAASQDGDAQAFAALVRAHQEVVFRAAYLVLREAQAAEDVAQEAFMRAYNHIGSFRTGEPFRPWILRIATNLALNEIRSRTRRHGLFDRVRTLASGSSPSPERDAVRESERTELWDAVNALPEDDRIVLYLRHFLELPEREIAATLNIAPGTVKSRLHRASTRLRTEIERNHPSLVRDSGADDA
jgi:RNA polymerase sigma-70 factor (ECF subfamily)